MARKAPKISSKAKGGRVTPKRRQSKTDRQAFVIAKAKGGPLHGQSGSGGGSEEAPF